MKRRDKKSHSNQIKYVLIAGDAHLPYEDKRAFAIMLKVAKSLGKNLKEIIFMGDFLDCFSVTSHSKNPMIKDLLKDEIEYANKQLDNIDKMFKDTKKIMLCGNHENRLERYLQNQAPALFGITSIEHLLNLNRRPNWKFVDYNSNQKYKITGTDLFCRHEPYGSRLDSVAQKAMCNLIAAHVHRFYHGTAINPITEKVNHFYCPGFLGDVRHKEVFGYTKMAQPWSVGFGMVTILPNGEWFYQNYEIKNYQVVFNNRIFRYEKS